MSARSRNIAQPSLTTTVAQRRKFVVLVVLASVVIILFWIFTLSFTFGKTESTDRPAPFFQTIQSLLSSGTQEFSKLRSPQ